MFNGQKLKELLESKGIANNVFSKRIGISEQTLYGYFKPTANPTSVTLEKIANELKYSLDYFFDREIDSKEINIGHQVRGNGNKVSGDITLNECKKEIEHLNALLEEKERVITEKERTIQILIQKQK